jgi:hypothetical protein
MFVLSTNSLLTEEDVQKFIAKQARNANIHTCSENK